MPSTIPMSRVLARAAEWIQKGIAVLEEGDEGKADTFFSCAEDALRDLVSGIEVPSPQALAIMQRIAELREREGREELAIYGGA